MQWIYEAMRKAAIKREEGQVTTCAFPSVSRLNEIKHEIDVESQDLLEQGHKEILQSECYEDYGCPSDIDKMKQEPVPLFLKTSLILHFPFFCQTSTINSKLSTVNKNTCH